MAKTKENSEPRKRGRPPVAPEKRRGISVNTWLSADELVLLQQIATQEGRPVSTILRMGALSWAARRARKG